MSSLPYTIDSERIEGMQLRKSIQFTSTSSICIQTGSPDLRILDVPYGKVVYQSDRLGWREVCRPNAIAEQIHG